MLNLLLEIDSANRVAAYVVLYAGLFATVSCSGHELEVKSNAQNVQVSTVHVSGAPDTKDRSEENAARLTKLYNDKSCIEFFNAFPSTFEEFNHLYGFDDEKGEHILYSKYEQHIPFFFDCSGVPNVERLKKSIEIGTNGRWEADASALVQNSTFELIKDNPHQTEEILNALPDNKASSFWRFMFDGPHPGDKEIIKKVNLLRDVLGKNSKQSKLLVEQHKKLLADWSEH